MSDHDARHQSLAALHERRKQVIRLHKKQYGVMHIVELTGLSWPAVRTAIDLYEAGGLAAIKPKERGKKSGEGRKLSAEQEAHIRKLIVEKRPEQLKMEFALWTRAAVGQLIEHEFQIKLSVRGVGKYLKRWGFTPQKPIKRALGYPFNRSWRSCAMADLVQAGPRLAGALVLSAGLGARPWDAGPRRDPDTAPAHEQQPVPRPDRTAFRGSGSGGG